MNKLVDLTEVFNKLSEKGISVVYMNGCWVIGEWRNINNTQEFLLGLSFSNSMQLLNELWDYSGGKGAIYDMVENWNQ